MTTIITQLSSDVLFCITQSTIHSPDKFADTMVKGVHSLMEHTVGKFMVN